MTTQSLILTESVPSMEKPTETLILTENAPSPSGLSSKFSELYRNSGESVTTEEARELIKRAKAFKREHPNNTDLYEYDRKSILQFVKLDSNVTAIVYNIHDLVLYVDSLIVPLLRDKCLQITPTKTRAGECGNNIYPKFGMSSIKGPSGPAGTKYQYIHRLAYALRDIINYDNHSLSLVLTREQYDIHEMLKIYDDLSKIMQKRCRNLIVGYCTRQYKEWIGNGEVKRPQYSVDHINRDFFNSTVSNLRLATREEQSENQEKGESLRTKVIISALV